MKFDYFKYEIKTWCNWVTFETNLCSGHPYAPNLTKRTKQISHSVDIYLVDFALEKTRLVVKDNSCAQ